MCGGGRRWSTIAALEPFTSTGHHLNDVVGTGADMVRRIYGPAKYGRLELKRANDPDNVFCLSQNLRP